MTIVAILSIPQQVEGVTVSTVTLHTARSGYPCGQFLVLRHTDGRTEYRAVDDAQTAPEAPFDEVAATVRRNHFRRTYANLRNQFHGKSA